MTLRTLADVANAMGYSIKIEFKPKYATSWRNVAFKCPVNHRVEQLAANDGATIYKQYAVNVA